QVSRAVPPVPDSCGFTAAAGRRCPRGRAYVLFPGLAVVRAPAARGNEDQAQEVADQLLRWAAPRGIRWVQCYAWHARALAALGRGDFEYAYQWNAPTASACGATERPRHQDGTWPRRWRHSKAWEPSPGQHE